MPYALTGSMASSLLGVFRATSDADIVADLKTQHTADFLKALGGAWYAEESVISNAVQRKRSFNIIHLDTMVKVDVFAVLDRPHDRMAFSRKRKLPYFGSDIHEVWCCAPEDIVLHKIRWYASGGRVSERQWQDAIGVLRVQNEALDVAYLNHWAEQLGLKKLMDEAFCEAGAES